MIRFNFAALQLAASDIDETVRAMDQTLDDLNTSLRVKLQDWDGGAFGSYAETENMWMSAAQEIKVLLNSIQMAVERSNQDMLETEIRNAQRLGRFTPG